MFCFDRLTTENVFLQLKFEYISIEKSKTTARLTQRDIFTIRATCPFVTNGLTHYTFFSTGATRQIKSHTTCNTKN